MLSRILRSWFDMPDSRCNRSRIADATRTRQSHSTAHCRQPGSSASRPKTLAAHIEEGRRFMRSRPGEPFAANTFVLENCSAELVSTNREVSRTHHDSRNFAALRLTKEMYPCAGTF